MANIIILEQTCECCPEQYCAYKGSRIIGYIRLRWGHLTCDYLPNGRLTDNNIRVLDKVFNERADDQYKGSFDTEEEREYWLSKCKEALLNKYNELKKEITMAKITEDYVSFEIAKLLKEKGFDESISTAYLCCDGKYWDKRFKEMSCDICQNEWYDAEDTVEFGHLLLAPTLQMAMKWLREVHHIHVCPEYKTFFQERPKKIYHHWCNKIIGIGRCFRQGIQDLNELDSEYFYHCGCKTCHDTFEEACEEAIKYCLENLI